MHIWMREVRENKINKKKERNKGRQTDRQTNKHTQSIYLYMYNIEAMIDKIGSLELT